MTVKIKTRQVQDNIQWAGCSDLLARILSARGVAEFDDSKLMLSDLHHFDTLKDIDKATQRLATALTNQESICIVGDYDVDGATSTALMMRALAAFGYKKIRYFVPNRFAFGYGLSPKIIDHLIDDKPDLIITVDNGIVSHDGVAHANSHGIDVIVTDHHLAGPTLPDAIAVVNPNQPGDLFPSKHLAGVGVAFYVIAALRAHLRKENAKLADAFSMSTLLDLVAIGTVADLVPLDKNNRTLVRHGLHRIRAMKGSEGVNALIKVAKKSITHLVASDIAFAIAPRLNAAGRLDDMSLGVNCLLEMDPMLAAKKSLQLDELNQDRRAIEKEMKQQAMAMVDEIDASNLYAVCLFHESWHEGLIGLVASKVKEIVNRPTLIFSKDAHGMMKASGRSIEALHLQKLLTVINKDSPGLMEKFGGHAMAAGLSLKEAHFEKFQSVFQHACKKALSSQDLTKIIVTDGELSPSEMQLATVDLIDANGPWGQGFPEPVFAGKFKVINQYLVGQAHLKLVLEPFDSAMTVEAICFFVNLKEWPNQSVDQVRLVYQLDDNTYMGKRKLQLIVRHIAAA